MTDRIRRRLMHAACLAALVFGAVSLPSQAHEVPTDVVVQAIVKPDEERLDVLLRVPLEAMRDVNFPVNSRGQLMISTADDALHDAATIWLAREIAIYADGERLDAPRIEAVRLSLPSDRSFGDYERAMSHLRSPPLPDNVGLVRDQALFDVLLRYDIASERADIAVQSRLARLGLQTTTVLRFLPPDGAERVFEFSGDPGLVRLDPSWFYAFFRFVVSGIEHILDGADHLMFVICLLIPFRRLRPLIVIITSFTVAHSITLIASAFGMVPNVLWFPPLIETLIAASIVYMALENIVGSQWEKRWLIAFAFGLVHGFGFSFALSELMQFGGRHLVTSLLAFNLGVEIGQLLVIAVAVPIINWLFRSVVAERIGTIILSAILAHGAWHWMTERGGQLLAFSFSWPRFDYSFFAATLRWLMLAIVVGCVVWIMVNIYNRFLSGGRSSNLGGRSSSLSQKEPTR